MDHMQLLSDAIEQIALEKAGIMTRRARRAGAAGKGRARRAAGGGEGQGAAHPFPDGGKRQGRAHTDHVRRGFRRRAAQSADRLPLRPSSADNACAALGALLALKKKGFKIPTSAVRAGLADVHWPGRLEYFGRVLLDGAHNDPGVRALCGYLDQVDAKGEHRAHQRDDARQGDGKDVPAPRRARALRRLHPAEHPARHARRGAGERI